jgi:hypothetical protein
MTAIQGLNGCCRRFVDGGFAMTVIAGLNDVVGVLSTEVSQW